MKIRDKFDKAIEYLVKRNNYLAAEATKLGYPSFADYPKTAGIYWDKDKKKICFLFNEKFSELLTDEEFGFVVAHETTHLLNSHVFLIGDEIERMKRLNKSEKEIYNFKIKFNIAADCVVNDSLVNLYNLPKVMEEAKNGKPKIIYGKDVKGVERDCQDLTAMDVYYLIDNASDNQEEVDNHLWDSFFNADGSLNEDFVDSVKKFIEDNIQNSALSDEDMSRVEDMKNSMENSEDEYVSSAGCAAVSSFRPVDGLGRETLNWNKILFQFVETLKTEDVWTRPNKKLVSVYPDIILPSWKDMEKEDIFVAIDASGSISRKALTLFTNVVRNTPKRFRIKAISFDTRCYEYDIKGKESPIGGGGTLFHIIEDYIQNKLKKYPRAVFVLTDGAGSTVAPQHPNRWCWILYGAADSRYCSDMRYYHISDLLKRSDS